MKVTIDAPSPESLNVQHLVQEAWFQPAKKLKISNVTVKVQKSGAAMADDDWDRIFETFKRPWKIKPLERGYRIDDANKRPIVYVYSKGAQSGSQDTRR